MQFHIDHTPQKPGFEIKHGQHVFLAGSCFSENISDQLKASKFKTYSNPSGILFNPASIFNCLSGLVHHEAMNEKYLLSSHNVFFSYLHHSSVHDTDHKDLLKKINTQNWQASEFLKSCSYLIITFGTAYAYTHKALNEIVANCHKQPQDTFEKKLLRVEKIIAQYTGLINDLKIFNPELKIIFTVSPVKYLKDGLVENNLSKSVLLLSVHELVRQQSNCFYFPAYELVSDDLRDYRFYKPDLAHPNEQAVDYVWQKFSGCFFSENTQLVNKQILKLNKALDHRKLVADSEEAFKLRDFILRQKEEIKRLAPDLEL